jgi:aminoglycoside phosphotransferase (APT) family kinase protein
MQPETIPVRPDERFDETKLADYLRDKLDGADQPMTVQQFPGGAANLTYLLKFGQREYVLRRPPLGPVAPKSHDMAREFTVLSVLHEAFPPAPRAFHFCDDPEVIGAPFLIMERREGVVIRREMPPHFADDSARQMSLALVDRLVDFHAVDFAALGLSDLGKPEGFVARQIEGWYGRWQKAKVDEIPVIEEVYQWLLTNIPAEGAPSLLHNDYKLDNAMFSADDPSNLVAIFDWDMCTLGDPLCDLGTLLAYWTESDDPPVLSGLLSMPSPKHGFLTRAELVERYAERSGRSVDAIRFYHVLALYRLAIIIAQIYVRYHHGQTQDERFAGFGDLIPIIAAHAQSVAAG